MSSHAVLRPRLKTGSLRLRSIRGTSQRDTLRSQRGVLRANYQATVSAVPSLYYYLSQTCGISFTEADALLRQRRLWVGGKPLEEKFVLESQIPASIIPDIQFELVKPSGERVPVHDRRSHRFYGFFWATDRTVYGAAEAEPRSFIHVLQRRAHAVPLPLVGPLGTKLSTTMFCDGFEASSSPVLIHARGARLGVGGLSFLTNDSSLPPFFSTECGLDASYKIVFARQTPNEVIKRVMETSGNAVNSIVVTADVESQIKRSVTLDEPSAQNGERFVMHVDTPFINRAMFRAIHVVRPDSFDCVRLASFHLEALPKPPTVPFRKMTAAEEDQFFKEVKRLQVNRIVASLRDSVESAQ